VNTLNKQSKTAVVIKLGLFGGAIKTRRKNQHVTNCYTGPRTRRVFVNTIMNPQDP
jgi:hypothetical protein